MSGTKEKTAKAALCARVMEGQVDAGQRDEGPEQGHGQHQHHQAQGEEG